MFFHLFWSTNSGGGGLARSEACCKINKNPFFSHFFRPRNLLRKWFHREVQDPKKAFSLNCQLSSWSVSLKNVIPWFSIAILSINFMKLWKKNTKMQFSLKNKHNSRLKKKMKKRSFSEVFVMISGFCVHFSPESDKNSDNGLIWGRAPYGDARHIGTRAI